MLFDAVCTTYSKCQPHTYIPFHIEACPWKCPKNKIKCQHWHKQHEHEAQSKVKAGNAYTNKHAYKMHPKFRRKKEHAKCSPHSFLSVFFTKLNAKKCAHTDPHEFGNTKTGTDFGKQLFGHIFIEIGNIVNCNSAWCDLSHVTFAAVIFGFHLKNQARYRPLNPTKIKLKLLKVRNTVWIE